MRTKDKGQWRRIFRAEHAGSHAEEFVGRMFFAGFGDAFLDGGIGDIERWSDLWRRWELDGVDFSNGDLASALLVNLGVKNVFCRDDEFRFGRLGRWRGAVRDLAEDAGVERSRRFVLCLDEHGGRQSGEKNEGNWDSFHWEGLSVIVLPGGRGVERVATGRLRWPLAALPGGRRLGQAPPPPRPFGRFGGIVAVDADRLLMDSHILIRRSERVKLIHAETARQGIRQNGLGYS